MGAWHTYIEHRNTSELLAVKSDQKFTDQQRVIMNKATTASALINMKANILNAVIRPLIFFSVVKYTQGWEGYMENVIGYRLLVALSKK